MAGRNTKLNKTLQNKIVKHLKTGATVADVCRHVGIHPDTYYDWLKRGDEGEAPFSEFSDAVTRATGDAKITAIATLRSAMTPYEQTQVATKTFTETRLNRKGEPYDYTRTEESKTVTLFAGDWRAAVEYLKRRYPGEWSEKLQLDININVEVVVKAIQALEDAGIDVQEFFEKAITRAEQRKLPDSSGRTAG